MSQQLVFWPEIEEVCASGGKIPLQLLFLPARAAMRDRSGELVRLDSTGERKSNGRTYKPFIDQSSKQQVDRAGKQVRSVNQRRQQQQEEEEEDRTAGRR